ncbi:MAG: hypothetical protein H7A35_10070 [Planctomycetales bacterium]|nr:hypothetical protein [bacterium]UNM07218.1 MAG: hypothetical protein H7A35_10070 [Planctomycetales bacterium]
MLKSFFLRMTDVPWDEFCVAWRLYNAQHGARIRFLFLLIVGGSLFYGLLTMYIVFPAIDLDGAGSFFVSERSYLLRPYAMPSSPFYLLAIAIPFAMLRFPARLDETIQGIQGTVNLCARITGLSVSYTVVLIFCLLEPFVLRSPQIASLNSRTDLLSSSEHLLFTVIASIYLAVPIFLLQRFLNEGLSPTRRWYAMYICWALTFLAIKNCSWDWYSTGFQDTAWTWLQASENPLTLLLIHLPVFLMLRSKLATLILMPACCLNVLFFAFVYRHFTDYASGAFFTGISQESILAPVMQSIGWPLVGTYQVVMPRIVDLIQ